MMGVSRVNGFKVTENKSHLRRKVMRMAQKKTKKLKEGIW